jgi:RNA polymerase sigma-70 factor (ECF subfamily)
MATRSNADWVRDLRAGQAEAVEELRAQLVRAARYALRRRGLTSAEQLAEDCAQDALIVILRRLGDFRGDSRFTTWAYTFAINMALAAGRREAWKDVSLDALMADAGAFGPSLVADHTTANPEQAARRAEAWAVVREVIARDLTERQRAAIRALVVDEVPLDELVRHWNSTRNAVYKLVHDARRRLKSELEARGFRADEVLALFAERG